MMIMPEAFSLGILPGNELRLTVILALSLLAAIQFTSVNCVMVSQHGKDDPCMSAFY